MEYQLCPKCLGQGVVSRPPGIPADQEQWGGTQASYPRDVCHGAKVLLVEPMSPKHDNRKRYYIMGSLPVSIPTIQWGDITPTATTTTTNVTAGYYWYDPKTQKTFTSGFLQTTKEALCQKSN